MRNLLIFCCLLSCLIVTFGCNSKASQMKQLAEKMKMRKNGDSNSKPADQPTAKSKPKNESAKPADEVKKSEPEKEKAEFAEGKVDKFLEFETQLKAKFDERRKGLSEMGKIFAVADAFSRYIQKNKHFPNPGIPKRNPNLSWRVELLPELGYPELFKKFQLDARYTSPVNRRLLKLIPPEYETLPGTTKTNFLLPINGACAYKKGEGQTLKTVEKGDGIRNTIAFFEVEDEFAQPWTAPQEFTVKAHKENEGIFRRGGFAVLIFADGAVEKITKKNADPKYINAMISCENGDLFPSSILEPIGEGELLTAAEQSIKTAKSNTKSGNKEGSSTDVAPQKTAVTVRSPSPINEVEVKLKRGETISMKKKNLSDLFKYRMARMMVSTSDSNWDYGWSPALRRPAFSVRTAVSISVVGQAKKLNPVKPLAKTAKTNNSQKNALPGEKKVEEKLGRIGLDALVVVRNTIRDGSFGSFLAELAEQYKPTVSKSAQDREPQVPDSGDEKIQQQISKKSDLNFPGLEITTSENSIDARKVADFIGADLLIDFVVDTTKSPQVNFVSFTVWDVQSRRELFRSRVFNNIKIMREQADPANTKDVVFDEMKELQEFLENQLAISEIPQQLNRSNILERLKKLLNYPNENKLPFLVEARFYFEKGLITTEDYKSFCKSILGDDEAGLTLAIGTPEFRLESIKRFLPVNFEDDME